MSKSRIYKTIEKNDIKRIVCNIFDNDTEVLLSKILTGGLFNTTYFIKTEKPKKELVLRIAPVREELLLDFEKDMMRSEPEFYRLFEANGIPAPKVIIYDDTHKIISRDYIITEYIDSIPFSDSSFRNEYKDKIQYELGLYTAKIHSIKADTFGWPNKGSALGEFKRWSDVIKIFTREISEKTSNYNVFDEKYIKEFDDFFHKNIGLFDIKEKPSLVHNDLWQPNILVKQVNNQWEIAAIIDADRALYADREYEFALWANDPKFMSGYGRELDMSLEGKLRRRAYSLILSFLSSYVHKVQYDNMIDYENCKTWALNELKEIYK